MFLKADIWNVQDTEFPTTGTPEEKLKFVLNYAILAPSSHNTQPWRFKIESGKIYYYADRTRSLPVADPDGRELIISCGAALFNLRIALHHFGYASEIKTFPDSTNPDLLACIELGHPIQETTDEKLLFQAIKARHTNRHDYQNWDVPETLLKWLQKDAISEGATLQIIKGDIARSNVAELVAQGDHLQMADPNFRNELAAWIRPSTSKSQDGLPIYTHGIDEHFEFATPLFAFVLRTLDMGNSVAERSRKLLECSPVIVVLNTKFDTSANWLAVGQALQRVLLRAQTVKLFASFLNQPIQIPQLRSQLSKLLGDKGYPQIMLRLGFGQEAKPTPRRTVDEVMSK
ncbi:MAG: nitroreductase [Calothrix sp. C42_A2020_038]|nr:nitroreductase [Calothrix sp. C42_A2020_038]